MSELVTEPEADRPADALREERVERRVRRYRVGIVVYRLITGGIEFAVAGLLLALSPETLNRLVDWGLGLIGQGDSGDVLHDFAFKHLEDIERAKTIVVVGLLILGVNKMVGAAGLWFRKPWGYYYMLTVLAIFLPLDTYAFVRSPTLLPGILLTINIAILVILVVHRRRMLRRSERADIERRAREGDFPESEFLPS